MITQRRMSTSSALAAVEASGERITVETLLIRNQKNREFERRAQEYMPDGPIVEPDLFSHKGVHYWEDNYDDVIVVPSLSLDPIELAKVKGITHYEERSLFNLILLRKPRTRLIYVTSVPLDPAIIEYYWKLMPERIPFSEITRRIIPLSVHDDSPRPLTQKLLEKPRLVQRIKKLIRNTESACLTCFNSTKYELELSEKLGIPLLATNPDTISWGTKQGSHQIFTEAGIPHPEHTKLCFNEDDLVQEIAALWKSNPQCPTLVLKLNDSFTGEGNALLSLDDIIPQADRHTLESISQDELYSKIKAAFPTIVFQSKIETWASFLPKIAAMGWLAELFIDGYNKTSPSGQAVIDRNGEVTILSTHEQILGGDSKQVYLGCSFPAKDAYRLRIQEYTKKVGEVLASKGVLDHFSVDFVAFQKQENSEFELSAIEINLRQGGTTHPMMTLKLLTDGDYDEDEGHFINIRGNRKFYVASDNICGEDLKCFVPQDLMETFMGHELHFNSDTEKGCVFHLLGALSKYGKVGVTCIGDSPEEAQSIFDRTVEMLHQQAKVKL